MTGAASEPHTDADGSHVCHPLGENAKPVIENISDDW
jgi:hypothetical protein